MKPWQQYQEDAAAFFRSLGLEAEVDGKVAGTRTTHNVDVVVRTNLVGFDLLWVVECKHWASQVSKLHVLALRQIVTEVGADRGVLLSESGFQSGAEEAAALTNVQLSSLAQLSVVAAPALATSQLRALQDRVDLCRERYWAMSKTHRIEQGLRPEAPAVGYSAEVEIQALEAALKEGQLGRFPTRPNTLASLVRPDIAEPQVSAIALVAHLEPYVQELEARLAAAEEALNPRMH